MCPDRAKPVTELTSDDFLESAVWEYAREREAEDDTLVRPVITLPVVSLDNRIVGTKVILANGQKRWATLSNVSLDDPKATKHFLSLAVEETNQWFFLARYFDVDWERHGPQALCTFLGMSNEDVFPITYDISNVAVGAACVVRGQVDSEPTERLSEEALIELSLRVSRD